MHESVRKSSRGHIQSPSEVCYPLVTDCIGRSGTSKRGYRRRGFLKSAAFPFLALYVSFLALFCPFSWSFLALFWHFEGRSVLFWHFMCLFWPFPKHPFANPPFGSLQIRCMASECDVTDTLQARNGTASGGAPGAPFGARQTGAK